MQTFNIRVSGGMKITAELISSVLVAYLTGLDCFGGRVLVEEREYEPNANTD